MAARGRRGDPAAQAAKGHPGRRRKSVKKMIAEADRVASLLAAAPPIGDEFSPPVFLTDPTVAPALKIWRDFAPELRRTKRLSQLHRLHFAMFCVYYGEWLAASDDIRRNGTFQMVATVSGSEMERTRPIVAFREIAYRNVMELGKEFGLTPREEYALVRDQADAVSRNPGLFGDQRQPASSSEPPAPAKADSLIGSLDALDSEPPPGLPN
ncbi:P27 family phage terminase small subunit [Kaistia geumhonensis]|uniref:P27 family predicted phage terminase small subunit n=1 Tax=Kaistia geumhonensis TaxID=410839 RepID=A0ABU0M5S8_9HYPH|nr:P27 family phage terminase small subunit [Kaistia geumhonensis]MCX5478463.1 P27 family phage terminase small subunit [Kaistia geumhonensis]MDQ0516319.1 P27 family predicted phage terminase small subunit [Kaistia geumhonensis]